MKDHFPNIEADLIDIPSMERLTPREPSTHKPRILLIYGSTRERSFSRLVTQEAARLLEHFGAETRIFNPSGLPLPDDAPDTHPKVVELRELMQWSEGQVWCSPERHGSMSAVFKAQITGCHWRWARYVRPKVKPWPSCRFAAALSLSTW